MLQGTERLVRVTAMSAWAASALAACAAAREAPRVDISLGAYPQLDNAVVTNRGYRIELAEARVVLQDLEFAVGGEAHAANWRSQIGGWLIPIASAHPGHLSGGEVTGELRGRFVASWRPASETPLGTASLIAGKYESANFTLSEGTEMDALEPGDTLLGHTAIFRGSATRAGERREFSAAIDAAAGESAIAGVPFAAPVSSGMSTTLDLELLLRDPFEGDTLFDDIEFAQLKAEKGGVLVIAANANDAAARAAHALLVDALQAPDHFSIRTTP
jgi:hypothetical protein